MLTYYVDFDIHSSQGRIQGGGAPGAPPPPQKKLEKI